MNIILSLYFSLAVCVLYSSAATFNRVTPCRGTYCSKTLIRVTTQLPTTHRCENQEVECPTRRPGCYTELQFPNGPACPACEVCIDEQRCSRVQCVEPGIYCKRRITTFPNGLDCPSCVTCADAVTTEEGRSSAVVSTTESATSTSAHTTTTAATTTKMTQNCPKWRCVRPWRNRRKCQQALYAAMRGCPLTCPACIRWIRKNR